MILSVLFRDVCFATLWLIVRSAPFAIAYWLITHLNPDAPIVGCYLLVAIAFLLPFIGFSLITVAVPALFWRYRTKHQTRLITLDGKNYRQVKIFGIWFFIAFSRDGGYHMCSNHWFSLDTLWEYSCDNPKFTSAFEHFVNAWRFGETAEVLKYLDFEGGRLKK